MLDIKPIYNTGTIMFIDSPEKVSLKKIDSTYIKDPKGIIPNGIYKVFKHEKSKQMFLLIFNTLLFIGFFIYLICLSTFLLNSVNKFWFFPISVALCLISWKLVSLILDTRHLKQSIDMYRESLEAGSRLTPPFISNLYIKLHVSQVRQNWLVTSILFYGTIFTLLFWWLKDVDWWIFHWKQWILDLTKKPDIIGVLLISILFITLIFHIYFTVYRKKRIIDIQSFFGNEVIPQSEIHEITTKKNKFYRRIFLISILLILVIPFIAWIIYKKCIKKSK